MVKKATLTSAIILSPSYRSLPQLAPLGFISVKLGWGGVKRESHEKKLNP
jgi:hypothetical protein